MADKQTDNTGILVIVMVILFLGQLASNTIHYGDIYRHIRATCTQEQK